MINGTPSPPIPQNEPVKGYEKGSSERKRLVKTIETLKNTPIDIPMIIGGKEVFTTDKKRLISPYKLNQNLGCFNYGDKSHLGKAINAAAKAKKTWATMPWEERASIFLKMADLIAGPMREEFNATTMLGQGKNIHQAEIDAVCELVDFLKFNVHFASEIYKNQPASNPGVWNRMDYRPLEGFVFAITPFNFTSICANLCIAPALMGNTVVWKPADTQVYSAHTIMKAFKLAGLPDGVINMVTMDGPSAGEVVFNHPDFAGLHFTGSTKVFKTIWKEIGKNIERFKSYPRIVGETGGKDFIVAHPSADPESLITAIVRGAFEYQGQKCSAASRAYIPKSLWPTVKKGVITQMKSLKMGSPENFENFFNCVISEDAFNRITKHLEYIKTSPAAEILQGGKASKKEGYFIEPTLVLAKIPDFKTMCEEIFGPVITVYVYKDKEFEETLDIVDQTGNYALTGAIFSTDRTAINKALKKLKQAAGNFYINDKPTGAVVGQQPFGGARGSGTNDKAGSYLNLLRWVSPQTIKETFVPPTDYRYPFLD